MSQIAKYIPEEAAFNFDAAGKLKVSQGTTLNEYSFRYNNSVPDLMDLQGTGTSSHVNGENGVFGTKLEVTAGQYLVYESRYPHYYAKGKSQKHEETFQNFQLQPEIIKRVGYFSTSVTAPFDTVLDGMSIESNGVDNEYYLCLHRQGTVVLRLARGDWDDPLDGTGVSGETIDFSSFMISDNDFVWLGGKGARWRFAVGGKLVEAHEYKHAGDIQGLIMSSPNQPIRWEIRATGSATETGVLYAICAEVETEGSLNSIGLPRNIDIDANTINANSIGTYYVLVGFRLLSSRRNNVLNITGFGAFATTNDAFRVTIFKNPNVVGAPVWQTYNSTSALEYFLGDTVNNPANLTITGGEKLKSFGVSQRSGESSLDLRDVLYQATRNISGTPDNIVIAVTPLTSQLDISGQIDILERVL